MLSLEMLLEGYMSVTPSTDDPEHDMRIAFAAGAMTVLEELSNAIKAGSPCVDNYQSHLLSDARRYMCEHANAKLPASTSRPSS